MPPPKFVMPGLDPGIHDFAASKQALAISSVSLPGSRLLVVFGSKAARGAEASMGASKTGRGGVAREREVSAVR
jgi:hypothetical protein